MLYVVTKKMPHCYNEKNQIHIKLTHVYFFINIFIVLYAIFHIKKNMFLLCTVQFEGLLHYSEIRQDCNIQ